MLRFRLSLHLSFLYNLILGLRGQYSGPVMSIFRTPVPAKRPETALMQQGHQTRGVVSEEPPACWPLVRCTLSGACYAAKRMILKSRLMTSVDDPPLPRQHLSRSRHIGGTSAAVGNGPCLAPGISLLSTRSQTNVPFSLHHHS
ncbi:hypothetical protein JB92DRAFT_1042098 [Gautieria morchelliformis]|nr:hypothetical protein JB92DRAFT_1042098 [Gautieria morchelliformis]